MKIGYARVSTGDQNLEAQIDALRKDGCEKIFTDKMSGTIDDRPGFAEALDFCRPGDVLVVWKLDRMGRGLRSLLDILDNLQCRGIALRSLTEQIDTTTALGKLFFAISGAFAAYEREVLLERTLSGLEAARARGRIGGRPRKVSAAMVKQGRVLFQSQIPVTEICDTLGISRGSFYLHRMHKESKPSATFA
ncbi:MAG: recombinase family protein [Coleofasciculaceae cyanobacterium SM2_3_26]|nr:recombinase family protein [Coleofasciculaceae cyanobacterium SM2_3_26]